MTIDFADIQSIAFSSITNDRITVKLDLKRGEDLGLKIRRRSGFAGQMNVGVYRILAEEVSRIDFK